jgi:hypothetical protein
MMRITSIIFSQAPWMKNGKQIINNLCQMAGISQ